MLQQGFSSMEGEKRAIKELSVLLLNNCKHEYCLVNEKKPVSEQLIWP